MTKWWVSRPLGSSSAARLSPPSAASALACRRARKTGGRIALLTVIEPSDFQHWMAVEQVMRGEMREEAEENISAAARPIPRLPPVTSTTLPSSSAMVLPPR